MLISVVTIIFIYIYDVEFNYLWLSLILYPFAIVPYTYFLSFLFDVESTGEKLMLIHNFLLGGLLPIAIFVLWLIDTTWDAGEILMWIFKFSPMFCLCESVINMPAKNMLAIDSGEMWELDFDVAGGSMLFLGI